MKNYNSSLNVENENIIIQEIFGVYDKRKTLIENELDIKIELESNKLVFIGEEKQVAKAVYLIENLMVIINKKKTLSKQELNYQLQMAIDNKFRDVNAYLDEILCTTYKGKHIKPKTFGQKEYIDTLNSDDIVFGVGPAGTGKTYLAVAKAISSFKKGQVNKIIITRPAVEAGENLGFLPGDLQDKISPYLRPINDALYDILGPDALLNLQERGSIEIAPLAYMRGRTLDAAYVILDEAQNTTKEQMKMFLTRIGHGSKAIITGDITQTDLPKGKKSGLIEALKILEGINDIGIIRFSKKDVVRHKLVQKIIAAYENYEQKQIERNL